MVKQQLLGPAPLIHPLIHLTPPPPPLNPKKQTHRKTLCGETNSQLVTPSAPKISHAKYKKHHESSGGMKAYFSESKRHDMAISSE